MSTIFTLFSCLTFPGSIKEKLRATPNHASTSSWPRFFYPRDQFDPSDLDIGLLRGELLLYVRGTLSYPHNHSLLF